MSQKQFGRGSSFSRTAPGVAASRGLLRARHQVAVNVADFHFAEPGFLQLRLDLGAVPGGDKDHLVGVKVLGGWSAIFCTVG